MSLHELSTLSQGKINYTLSCFFDQFHNITLILSNLFYQLFHITHKIYLLFAMKQELS